MGRVYLFALAIGELSVLCASWCSLLPGVNSPHRWHRHGAHAHAAVRVVLGGLSGRLSDAGHIGCPAPTATRAVARYETAFQILPLSCARAWCARRDQIGGPANTSRPMRPGLAGVHERVEAFTTRAWWLRRSGSVSASPAPSSIRVLAASGWPWFLTAAPRAWAASMWSRAPESSQPVATAPVSPSTAFLTWHRRARRSAGCAEEFMPIVHRLLEPQELAARDSSSPQHLQTYLNEFTFRFNRRFYPFNAFRSLLGIAGGVTSPTYAQLYSAKSRTTTSSGGL